MANTWPACPQYHVSTIRETIAGLISPTVAFSFPKWRMLQRKWWRVRAKKTQPNKQRKTKTDHQWNNLRLPMQGGERGKWLIGLSSKPTTTTKSFDQACLPTAIKKLIKKQRNQTNLTNKPYMIRLTILSGTGLSSAGMINFTWPRS